MAKFHGKSGSITWAGAGFESDSQITSWEAEITADTAEATNMGDTYKTFLPGFFSWTATVEALADETQSQLAIGVSALLTLEMIDAGDNLEGTAICTGISFSTDMNDVGKVTHTFQGNGVIAYGAS